MFAIIIVCYTQAQSCLSTRWALNCCFAWIFGTAAVLAQGGVGVRRLGPFSALDTLFFLPCGLHVLPVDTVSNNITPVTVPRHHTGASASAVSIPRCVASGLWEDQPRRGVSDLAEAQRTARARTQVHAPLAPPACAHGRSPRLPGEGQEDDPRT